MKVYSKLISLVIVLVCLSLTLLWAGEKKCCSTALKGIIHLSDNDVRFHSKEGVTVFVDPLADPKDESVVKAKMTKADLILITHPHGDHFQPDILKTYQKVNPEVVFAGPTEVVKLAKKAGIKMKAVEPNQKYGLAGVKVKTVPAYFSKGDSHPKENGWVGYVIHLNGMAYYVTGDTEPVPEMTEVNADVIFPLVYGCGGNIEQAVKMTKLSGASVVVPVHFGGNEDVIKKFIACLPKETQSAFFAKGQLIAANQ